jgi:hypothetical protein
MVSSAQKQSTKAKVEGLTMAQSLNTMKVLAERE